MARKPYLTVNIILENIQRLINQKQLEVMELERRIVLSKGRIEGYKEAISILKEQADGKETNQ